ncbi:OB-fold putative lipoprotein (plasmid) [Clostridium estertheticum]|uniref:OB-fold putative lipoprotein n=1 Tax=Clostridium estertheticum TaxID=238834 RepID=UPI001C7E1038|nr:OB-fold putative lipoprotein [Clostridium estertheticum]MBX4259714.1 OB-fold putative lipoprotein [Clostridium estertheticum]WLC73301.1 OB-fold putative lipoprotein [Clostridium estertheticum]
MKDVLKKYIPGFRSDIKWKKIIAIIYYMYSISRLFRADFYTFLFTITIPFIVFSLIGVIKNENRKKSLIILLCGLFLFIGSIEAYQPTTHLVDVINVTAFNLSNNYESNEVRADTLYKDKTINLTGTIKDISNVLGDTTLTIGSYSNLDITCYFKDKVDIDKISNLHKGNVVTIQGVCDGKIIDVIVNDCMLK